MTSTQQLRKAALDRLKAVGGELAAPLLLLFKNDVEIGPDSVFADLEEADFDGYVRPAALTFGSSFLNVDDEWEMDAPSTPFIATGATTPNVIYGWAIVTAAGDSLLIAEKLETPVSILAVNDGLVVQPRFIYGR